MKYFWKDTRDSDFTDSLWKGELSDWDYFVDLFVFFFFFLATLNSLQDLSSPTRDWTCALGSESTES